MGYLSYRCTNIVLLFYTTYISVDLAHHKIFRAKVGKGGIKDIIPSVFMPRGIFVCRSNVRLSLFVLWNLKVKFL